MAIRLDKASTVKARTPELETESNPSSNIWFFWESSFI